MAEKKLVTSPTRAERLTLLERTDAEVLMQAQTDLLSLNRTSIYYTLVSPRRRRWHSSMGVTESSARGRMTAAVGYLQERYDEPPLDEQTWHRMTEEITAGMRDWRLQHPKATLREIEHELDTRWARVRARMLEDLALASAATNWAATPDGQQPTCPDCDQPLQPRGLDTRTLQTHGGQALTLNRQYATCSACGAGLFCHATRNCQLSM